MRLLCPARKTGYQRLQSQKKNPAKKYAIMIAGDNFFLLLLFCVFQNFNNKHKFSNNCLKKKRTQHTLLCFLLLEKMMHSAQGAGGRALQTRLGTDILPSGTSTASRGEMKQTEGPGNVVLGEDTWIPAREPM